ncbi:hypothetical protein LJB92_03220 [Bacteroidales bacterium OttesenSCG-928-M06]|nr:hypothetical protein [Bacteroidales bacterium OttesenSCG-928-M06]
MKNKDELERLKAELAASKKEIKSLKGKLQRSQSKVSKQKLSLKKKEIRTIEVTDEQLQSLSNQLPDIDIMNLLFD